MQIVPQNGNIKINALTNAIKPIISQFGCAGFNAVVFVVAKLFLAIYCFFDLTIVSGMLLAKSVAISETISSMNSALLRAFTCELA